MNAVAKIETKPLASARFNADQVDLIKKTICPGATDDELRLFLYHAEKTGLDPLARQIYSVERQQQRNGKWVTVRSIQTSIDGFRLIAERSGQYAGQVGPFWCGPDGQWADVWMSSDAPVAAKVGVLRHDFKEPCWGVARFDAYAQKFKDGNPTRMWASMGDVMIAKCAESLALRKAFPQELSGLYTSDEMEQATEAAPVARLTPPSPPKAVALGGQHSIQGAPLTEADERALDRASYRDMAHETPEHDAETGEITDDSFDDENLSGEDAGWRKWGDDAIAAFSAAKTALGLSKLLQKNVEPLERCKEASPRTYDRAMMEYRKRAAFLSGATIDPTLSAGTSADPLPF